MEKTQILLNPQIEAKILDYFRCYPSEEIFIGFLVEYKGKIGYYLDVISNAKQVMEIKKDFSIELKEDLEKIEFLIDGLLPQGFQLSSMVIIMKKHEELGKRVKKVKESAFEIFEKINKRNGFELENIIFYCIQEENLIMMPSFNLQSQSVIIFQIDENNIELKRLFKTLYCIILTIKVNLTFGSPIKQKYLIRVDNSFYINPQLTSDTGYHKKYTSFIRQISSTLKKQSTEIKIGSISSLLNHVPIIKAQSLFLQDGSDKKSPLSLIRTQDEKVSSIYLELSGYAKMEEDMGEIICKMMKRGLRIAESQQLKGERFSKVDMRQFRNNNCQFIHGICTIDGQQIPFQINFHLEGVLNSILLSQFVYNVYTQQQSIEQKSLKQEKITKKKQGIKLKNVHIPIIHKGKGTNYLINGDYTYSHYYQDNISDKGWGCAYRSLQTIISWYFEQNIIKPFPMPTHEEIQIILVKLGDKPAEFISSQEWIGAFELSLVLNQLLNIESRIVHLTDGADILSKIEDFRDHFLTQGTPIMIGGGVLAFTLLGVSIDYENEEKTRFLILDPHYTGADVQQNIVKKKGISWKGMEMFLEGTFYNFFLPSGYVN